MMLRTTRVAYVVAFVVASLGVTVPPAQAIGAVVGRAYLVPATGTVDGVVRVQTSGPCTRGVSFTVRIAGPGLPKDGANINGVAPLTQLIPTVSGVHLVQMSATFADFAADNIASKRMLGTYSMIFRCRDKLDLTSVGDFVGTFTVAANGRYSSNGVPASATSPTAGSGIGAAPSARASGQPTPAASASAPAASDPSSAPSASSPGAAAPAPQAVPASESQSLGPLLFAAGGLLVLLSLMLWWRGRRSTDPDDSAPWPDAPRPADADPDVLTELEKTP